jgi:small subunit ribosomal protein S8
MVILSDPIGDFLTRMRNAQSARRDSCSAPWSKIKEQLGELLKKEQWIKEVIVEGEGKEKTVTVTFFEDKPRLEIKRISKPGRRVYSSSDELKPVLRGFGVSILTTSKGLMTDAQAKKERVGGEVLCTIA